MRDVGGTVPKVDDAGEDREPLADTEAVSPSQVLTDTPETADTLPLQEEFWRPPTAPTGYTRFEKGRAARLPTRSIPPHPVVDR